MAGDEGKELREEEVRAYLEKALQGEEELKERVMIQVRRRRSRTICDCEGKMCGLL